jgi:predicted DNA-binding transcriptional regulator AlpA
VTGNELQALLDARAIKPVAWAAALGVNQSTIYRLIERGDTPLPSPWSHALAAWKSGLKPL